MDYLTKAEIRPWHKKFCDWIENIRNAVRLQGVTFDCRLVGSAKRNMVIRHHNKGFDLDYQIIIHKNKKHVNENRIKQLFMELLDPLIIEEGFEHCDDSTSAITIKMVDAENSKIIVGYDVVIIKNHTLQETEQTEILRHYKEANSERWAFEPLSDMSNANAQFRKINGNEMWQELRERYYKKKIEYTGDKKSFQLLHEAVNETLNKFGVQ